MACGRSPRRTGVQSNNSVKCAVKVSLPRHGSEIPSSIQYRRLHEGSRWSQRPGQWCSWFSRPARTGPLVKWKSAESLETQGIAGSQSRSRWPWCVTCPAALKCIHFQEGKDLGDCTERERNPRGPKPRAACVPKKSLLNQKISGI